MQPVMQTQFGGPGSDKPGNCVAACIASVLDLSIDDVPNFVEKRGDWWRPLIEWLSDRDCLLVKVIVPDDPKRAYVWPVIDGPFVLLSGKSPRGDFGHVVVGKLVPSENSIGDYMHAYDYVHDPHPDGTFLDGAPTEVWFISFLGRKGAP